jgi:antitoxin PrlF
MVDTRGKNSYHCGMKAIVSQKGQVTIPKQVRTRLGIKAGTVLDFEADAGRLVARKAVEHDAFADLYGVLDLGESTDAFIERIRGR